MQKVLTAAEMREVDRLTTEKYGIPSILLMENAANAVARVIAEKLDGSVKGKRIVILCGKGNNGGDGAAAARILWTQGANCFVYLMGRVAQTTGDARVNFDAVSMVSESEDANWPNENCLFLIEMQSEALNGYVSQWKERPADCFVDALFGTGADRPLDGELGQLAEAIRSDRKGLRRLGSTIVSIDLPSGLNADSGEIFGPAVLSDITVTFTAPKPANVLAPAAGLNGTLITVNIGSVPGLIESQPSSLFVTETKDVSNWLKQTRFSGDSYKNKRGHALLIAGSENYSGAAVLCGNAAIRSGVGLVTLGVPRSSKDSVAERVVPEVMVRTLAETDAGSVAEEAFDEIREFSENIDAIAIGSGLSASQESTRRLVRRLVADRTMPTILDADALTLLSPFKAEEIRDESKPPLILTPHQGEFLKMLGTENEDAIKDRVTAVREFAQKHHVILVLKGERVLIGEPGGRVVVNPTGNSGLGKAGNGDTLTGIIAGFAAQAAAMKVDMFETVVAAVYIAALAGDIAENKYGKRVMTASDVKDCLAEAFAAFV